jgi:hypothetical protein
MEFFSAATSLMHETAKKQQTDTPTPGDAPLSAFASDEEMPSSPELQSTYRQERKQGDEEEAASLDASLDMEMRPGAVAVAGSGVFRVPTGPSVLSEPRPGPSDIDEESILIIAELALPSQEEDELRRRNKELESIVSETVTGSVIVVKNKKARKVLIGAAFALLLLVGVVVGVTTIKGTTNEGTTIPAPDLYAESGFCNFGPDGTGASSICQVKSLGDGWCDASGENCESGCNGRWCTSEFFPSPSIECLPGWKEASWTHFNSYAPCCEDSPNYDPTADRTECDNFSACDNIGQLAYSGQQSLEWVQNNSIISFFSIDGDNTSFGNKTMRVSAAGLTVEALVADTCVDSECDGCCSNNADPSGYLVDMEYWTVMNNFGPDVVAHGQICWQLV